jgi:GrpB-like predicted nucleotidyltransferase (UPF0157 family)
VTLWNCKRVRLSLAEPVIIVPYDPQWPDLFAQLGRSLRGALGNTAVRIDHVGSTSVPGLAAKPIIDVQISVADFEPIDAYRLPLERLGYLFREGNPDRTKRYFRETPGERRTHIHVRRSGSWPEQFALLFRDYLRVHPAVAERYAERKRLLSVEYREDRRAYTAAKAPIIWEVMTSADLWNQETGWRPGPSDA